MQIWHQLSILDGVICCTHSPSFTLTSVTVVLIPVSLQQQVLYQTHNIPCAGHQGYLKMLNHLKEEAYWPGMAGDVQRYCQECSIC